MEFCLSTFHKISPLKTINLPFQCTIDLSKFLAPYTLEFHTSFKAILIHCHLSFLQVQSLQFWWLDILMCLTKENYQALDLNEWYWILAKISTRLKCLTWIFKLFCLEASHSFWCSPLSLLLHKTRKWCRRNFRSLLPLCKWLC